MNGIEAARDLGITYRQLDYWIRQGVITPTEPGSRGRARNFTPRDIELLRLAVLLRNRKYPLAIIKFVIDSLNYWQWDLEPIALTIIAVGRKKGSVGRAGNYTWTNGWVHDTKLIPDFKNGRSLDMPDWTYLISTNFEPKPH